MTTCPASLPGGDQVGGLPPATHTFPDVPVKGLKDLYNKSPGSACLVNRGKFIWISGDVEKREDGWTITEFCNVTPACKK